MRSIWKMLAVILMMTGCGDAPWPGIPECSDAVTPCPGTRDTNRCALCQDENDTLGCQFHGDWKHALCVASCDTCNGPEPTPIAAPINDPGQLVKFGVHVCWPLRYRSGDWCGRCNDENFTLGAELCDKDGFCNPVVCVRDCNACELNP